MSRALVLTVVCAAAIVVPAASAAPALSHYRGVTLGDTVSVVADRLNVALSDVVVVHQRPTLVQQLTWRPHRLVSGTIVEPDPLAEMVLLFHLGRLVHVAVTYDRDRTEGLTNADLHDAFTRTYGTSMLLSTTLTPVHRLSSSKSSTLARRPVSRWKLLRPAIGWM